MSISGLGENGEKAQGRTEEIRKEFVSLISNLKSKFRAGAKSINESVESMEESQEQ